MKKMNPIRVNDQAYIDALSDNEDLAQTSYPDLKRQKQDVLNAYSNYEQHHGNPWLISMPEVSAKLKAGLLSHYSSPPNSIDYLAKITNSSPDVCPMCGSFKPFSRDHILPKSDYQVWAIFSKNLVPACDCNLKRGTALKGDPKTQARVLHPYYDDFMSDRLISCKFIHRNNFKWFDLEIVYVDETHPQIASIKYHTKEIVIKSGVLTWIRGQLVKLKEKPSNVIQTLPRRSAVTVDGMIDALTDCLERHDEQTGTKNNWHSIMCHGLLNSDGMIEWLRDRHNTTLI